LIADPGPFAKSAASLAKQFEVEMTGDVIQDAANSVEEFRPNLILYSHDNHLLLDSSDHFRSRRAGEVESCGCVFRSIAEGTTGQY
jgi:hypothetical protein